MAKEIIRVAGRRPHLCVQCRGDILYGQEYRQVGSKRYHRRPDCEHSGTTEIRFSKEIRFVPHLREDPLWRLWEPPEWRFVRSFERIAQWDYECWECEHSNSWHQEALSRIFAGDRYRAEVYVSDRGWEIRRFHDMCPYNPFEDDDYNFDEEEDETEETRAA